MAEYQEEIIKILKKELGSKIGDISLEQPKNPNFGDYAFPCFVLAKIFKKNPAVIASEVSGKLVSTKNISKIEAQGPYINFFVNKEDLSKNVLKQIYKEKEGFGKGKNKEKVMVEYSSPNTNKPLHLGHLRNIFIGETISNLLEFLGNKVIKTCLNNDRGIHITKSMLAYKKFGKSKKPNKKTDHFVGDFYVLFNKKLKQDKGLEKKAQEMLKKWEQGDKELKKLWEKMNSWALDGFDETYKEIGVKFDKKYYESNVFEKGKLIVKEGIKKGVFHKKKEGSVFIDLDKYGLGEKILLRADGTSVYITQDLYLAKQKFDDFKLDRSIYVVGSEQDYHFNVLFKILELLKYKFSDRLFHLSYGMVYLPEGRMKSREGTVIDADDILAEMKKVASVEIKKREKKIKKKELEERSKKIGYGALRYFMLKMDARKDIHFNPEESISFEGETGPYIQYAHARICSILRKNKGKIKSDISFDWLSEPSEQALTKVLAEYPEIVEKAEKNLQPSLVAGYLFKLAKTFNEFYRDCNILKEREDLKKARLLLIFCVKEVLGSGLGLLGIDALERM